MRVFIANQTPPGQPDGLLMQEKPLWVIHLSIGPASRQGGVGGGSRNGEGRCGEGWGRVGWGGGAVVIRHEAHVIAERRIAANPKGSTTMST